MPANYSSHTRILMGMPVTVKIVGQAVPRRVFETVFAWFASVDARFSTYKPDSEISKINAGLPESQWSTEMKMVLGLCEATKQATHGYFDIRHNSQLVPSGLVKGWAVKQAADKLLALGYENFYIEAGGDIQTHGRNPADEPWRIGIRNPFKREEIIKVLALGHNEGVATSGAYVRGDHIYNPHESEVLPSYFASVTIIGPDIYEADRFATAVYAMGDAGIAFIELLPGFEAYLVRQNSRAVMTSGLKRYLP